MIYKGLSQFVQKLEEEGALIRIKQPVSSRLEISEITDRIVKQGGPALLFENNGTSFPLLINVFGTEKRMALALNADHIDEIGVRLNNMFSDLMGASNKSTIEKFKLLWSLKEVASFLPKVVSGKGTCQEVVMSSPDLNQLPILTCWPFDGGPFITLPIVHTMDPNTGARNVGMYRMQVVKSDQTAMHWHLHKNSARHYRLFKEQKKKMPVTVTLGGDPVYTYSATAPLPDGIDEYILAGFLRGEKVKLVKSLTNDIYIPADADIVIEGYVDPNEEMILEGPFGDHTGYYSLEDYYPTFHVTCITHRRDAIYPATIVGVPPQEDALFAKATECIFLPLIKTAIAPEIIDMDMPVAACFHNLAIVKIEKSYPGQAIKVMNALWGAGQMMLNKMIVVVSGGVDIHSYDQVLKTIAKTVDPTRDIYFSSGPLDVLDHASSRFAFGGKMGIDATEKEFSEPIGRSHSQLDFSQVEKIKNVTAVNKQFADSGLLILAIDKKGTQSVKEIVDALQENNKGIKFIVFIDKELNVEDLNGILWQVSNNVDPARDITIQENQSCLFVDGTVKTNKNDHFERPWPNIVLSDDQTIQLVDKKWASYNLGDFIASPSLKYKTLQRKGGARVEE